MSEQDAGGRAAEDLPAEEQDRAANDSSDDGLLSRLRVIEDQPLERRAEAFSQLHDELQSQLEAADPSSQRG
ncbi:hypothetical protein [Homoserinimonas aerilata]|nr:hypothetical protein [Homoserinimonas aerilata]